MVGISLLHRDRASAGARHRVAERAPQDAGDILPGSVAMELPWDRAEVQGIDSLGGRNWQAVRAAGSLEAGPDWTQGEAVPELPEVETVANGVNARVRGQRIVSVWTSGKPQTFKSAEAEIEEALTGARIERVRRVGKTIVMTLAREDGRAEFLVHLGMTGRLLVSAAEVPLPPHTHAVLRLVDGREVRFVDPRRFGRLSVRMLEGVERGYAGPGVEPLTVSPADFAALFRGRKTAIKAALLNQSLLHGVGNIYADEALARAGVRPRRRAGRLTRIEAARLHAALTEVLTRAIELGGSSVSDYVDADGVRGFFQLEHRVYGRGGEPCRVCGTAIRKIVVGGRGTHFCPQCQR